MNIGYIYRTYCPIHIRKNLRQMRWTFYRITHYTIPKVIPDFFTGFSLFAIVLWLPVMAAFF